MKHIISLGFIFFFSSHAFSAPLSDFCEAVVARKAFNTTSQTEQSSIYNRARVSMCSETWSNYQQFRNAANNLGVNYGDAATTFGLQQGSASSDGQIQQARAKYCSMGDDEFISTFFSTHSTVTTDAAVAAWSRCVDKYFKSVSQGITAEVTDGPDYRYFDVSLRYKTLGQGVLSLQSLNASGPQSTVTCKVGGQQINPTPSNPYRFQTLSVTFRCEKNSPVRTLTSLNTNAGTISGLISYGQDASVYDRERITQELIQLRAELASTKSALTQTESY